MDAKSPGGIAGHIRSDTSRTGSTRSSPTGGSGGGSARDGTTFSPWNGSRRAKTPPASSARAANHRPALNAGRAAGDEALIFGVATPAGADGGTAAPMVSPAGAVSVVGVASRWRRESAAAAASRRRPSRLQSLQSGSDIEGDAVRGRRRGTLEADAISKQLNARRLTAEVGVPTGLGAAGGAALGPSPIVQTSSKTVDSEGVQTPMGKPDASEADKEYHSDSSVGASAGGAPVRVRQSLASYGRQSSAASRSAGLRMSPFHRESEGSRSGVSHGDGSTEGSSAGRARAVRGWRIVRDQVASQVYVETPGGHPLRDVVESSAQSSQRDVARWRRVLFSPLRPKLPPRDHKSTRAIVEDIPHPDVVDPECMFVSAWQLLNWVCIMSASMNILWRLSFDPAVWQDDWAPWFNSSDVMGYAIDFIFVVDTVLTFRTGYIEHGNKFMSRVEARRYALRQPHFALEVISAFPYDLIVHIVAPGSVPNLFLVRLTRLLRLRHLPRLFAQAEDAGGMTWRNVHQTVRMLSYTLLFFHIVACLWYRLSVESGFAGPNQERPFLAPLAMQELGPWHQYFLAFHWAVRAATSEGLLGEPRARNGLESIISLMITMFGIVLTSYLIGAVARLVGQLDASEARHRAKVAEIGQFFRHYGLEGELRREIFAFLQFSHEERTKQTSEVASDLNVTLRNEVSVFLTHDTLRKIPLFKDVEDGFVVSLAKTLTPLTVQRNQLVIRAGLPCTRVFVVHWGSLVVEVGGSADLNLQRRRAAERRRRGSMRTDGETDSGVDDTPTTTRRLAAMSPWAARLAMRPDSLTGREYVDSLHDFENKPGAVVDTLHPGSFCGQYVADERGFMPATSVRATTFCILYSLEHKTLKTVMERFPDSKQKVEGMLTRQGGHSEHEESQKRTSLPSGPSSRHRGLRLAPDSPSRAVLASVTAARAIRRLVQQVAVTRRRLPEAQSRSQCKKITKALGIQHCGRVCGRVCTWGPLGWLSHDCFVRGPRIAPHTDSRYRMGGSGLLTPRTKTRDSPGSSHASSVASRGRTLGREVAGVMLSKQRRNLQSGRGRRWSSGSDVKTPNMTAPASTAAHNAAAASSFRTDSRESAGNISGISKISGGGSVHLSRRGTSADGVSDVALGPRVINPQARFTLIWQLGMQLCVLYNIVMVPVRIAYWKAFSQQAFEDSDAMNIFVDVMYVLDLVVKARTAHYIRGMLVTDPSAILQNYMSSTAFRREIAAAFPFDLLARLLGASEVVHHSLRIIKVLRGSRFSTTFQAWATRWMDVAETTKAAISTVGSLLYVLLVCFHYATCFYWVAIATASDDGTVAIWPAGEVIAGAREALEGAPVSALYLHSFYEVMRPGGMLRSVHPPSMLASIFSSMISVLGIFLFAYAAGALGKIIADSDTAAADFRQRRQEVEAFLSNRRVPPDMAVRISQYLDISWETMRGQKIEEVCADLPYALARRLRLELFRRPLRRVDVFQACPDSTLSLLAQVLRVDMHPGSQVVFLAGELGTDLLVVTGGAISLYFGEDALRTIEAAGTAVAPQEGGSSADDGGEEKEGTPEEAAAVRRKAAIERSELEAAAMMESVLNGEQPKRRAPTSFTIGEKAPAEESFSTMSSYMPDEMFDPFTTAGPGQLVGEFSYFEGVRLTTAVTQCATELYAISFVDLHNILEHAPLLEARLRLVARRKLGAMAKIVEDIYSRAHVVPETHTTIPTAQPTEEGGDEEEEEEEEEEGPEPAPETDEPTPLVADDAAASHDLVTLAPLTAPDALESKGATRGSPAADPSSQELKSIQLLAPLGELAAVDESYVAAAEIDRPEEVAAALGEQDWRIERKPFTLPALAESGRLRQQHFTPGQAPPGVDEMGAVREHAFVQSIAKRGDAGLGPGVFGDGDEDPQSPLGSRGGAARLPGALNALSPVSVGEPTEEKP